MIFTHDNNLTQENSNIVFVIGLGHNKSTPGKRSPVFTVNGKQVQLFEWMWVRDVCKRLIKKMQRGGHSYYILNTEIDGVSLQEKCKRENKIAKDLVNQGYITYTKDLHANAAGVQSASGYEVWTSKGITDADPLAQIDYRIAEETGLWRMRSGYSKTNKGNDKESRFYFLLNTLSPATLPEMGFYTNKNECINMLKDSYKEKVAQYLYDTHLEYIKQRNTLHFYGDK